MNDSERTKVVDEVIGRVCDVAKRSGRKISGEEKLSLKMGLFYARDDEFNNGKTDVLVGGNLNLKALIECDEFSLVHDVFQIDKYICKDSSTNTFGTMTGFFVPRCGFEKVA